MIPLGRQQVLRIVYVFALFAFTQSSCKQADEPIPSKIPPTTDHESTKLGKAQALAYATLFGVHADNAGRPRNQARSVQQVKRIKSVNYAVEGADTLLYAVNFANDEGFMLISGDNSSFPIIAHADKGSLNLDRIAKNDPLYLVVDSYKKAVKHRLQDSLRYKTKYYQEWKYLGNKDYEYEIIPNKKEPTPDEETNKQGGRSLRKSPSGRVDVYPFTGKLLDSWSQNGNFNTYAQNNAFIGCPSVAIGMLLYDCAFRGNGVMTPTFPAMAQAYSSAVHTSTLASDVSKVFRQIADSIPNYAWGRGPGYESGARSEDILVGLRRLGFEKAQTRDFDVETLYKNLRYRNPDYAGWGSEYVTRGVLLAAYSHLGTSGHIWFCDGYYEQSYTITRKEKVLFWTRTSTWKEYQDRLYMNWGHGQGNGWYTVADEVWGMVDTNSPMQYMKIDPIIFTDLSFYRNPYYK